MEGKTIRTILCRPDDLPAEILAAVSSSPDHLHKEKGMIYLMADDTVITCPDDSAGNELIDMICRQNKKNKPTPLNPAGFFERCFFDSQFVADRSACSACGVTDGMMRSVVVFQIASSYKIGFPAVFSEIAPVEENDYTIPIDYHTLALVKGMQHQTKEELVEYTKAVIYTMEGEGITGIRAGIGCICTDVSSVRKSYREATDALSIGSKYHKDEQVYIYERQILERLMECIPPKKRYEIRQDFMKKCPAGKLPDEMLETVRVFFQNDLNITAASRQLFIHRNTLNYRLDKIKKDFELDLRSFDDAVIFSIVSSLPDKD